MCLKGLLQSHTGALLSFALICFLPSVSIRSVGFAQTAPAVEESARFAASDGAVGNQFGTSLGFSSGVGLVGAPSDDDNGTDSGAAYTYKADANGMVTATKLLASDGAAGDAFGSAVAIHVNVLVVGAPNAGRTGAAYVFIRKGARWVQKAKLVAKDGAVGDAFGSSVSVDGRTVVVGAPGKKRSTGAAYLFTKRGAGWPQTRKIVASDGAVRDFFGQSVTLCCAVLTTVVVGAPFDDDNGANSGAAYAFEVTASGLKSAKLLASDGVAGDFFGMSVAMNGNGLMIGATQANGAVRDSGQVYLYTDGGGDGGGGDGGGGDGGGEDAPPSNASTVSILGQRGSQSFSPNPVSPGGGMVVWRNDDGVTHRIVANDGSFDTGNLLAGATSSMVQPPAGGGNYHCSIHPTTMFGGSISSDDGGEPPPCMDYCE